MKNNSKKTPKECRPVLAKIEQINDLGKSTWYEVVYYDDKRTGLCHVKSKNINNNKHQ